MIEVLNKVVKRGAVLTMVASLSCLCLGQSPSGWQIEYKGELLRTEKLINDATSSSITWKKQEYTVVSAGDVGGATPPNSFPYYTFAKKWTLNGRVDIRLKWYGPGQPNTYPNYKIHSKIIAGASGAPQFNISGGTAYASNGFSAKSISNGEITVEDKKLIQPGKVLSHETPVIISATVEGGSLRLGMSVEASLDTRYAYVKATGLPNEYYIKGATKPSGFPLFADLWDGPELINLFLYTYREPKPREVPDTVGGSRKETRYIGLPEGYFTDNVQVIPYVWSTTYVGIVDQWFMDGEWYRFSEERNGTVAEETLPSAFNGWDIEILGAYNYYGACIHRNSSQSLSRVDRVDTNDSAKLTYRWTDGLTADSELQLLFRDRFVNPNPIGSDTIWEGGARPYHFPGGLPFTTKEYESYNGAEPRTVHFGKDPRVWSSAGAVVSIAAGVLALNPSSATAAGLLALLGQSLSIGDAGTQTGTVVPDNPFLAPTAKRKYDIANISPDLLVGVPPGASPEQKLNAVKNFLHWKALYIPELTRQVVAYEEYNVYGFVNGAKMRFYDAYLENQANSEAKKFVYKTEANYNDDE